MDEAPVTLLTRSVSTVLLAVWLLLQGASGAVTCRDSRRVTRVCNTSCCGSYETSFYCCPVSTPAPATVRWQYSVGAALGGVLLVMVISIGVFLYVRAKRPCRSIRPGAHPNNQHLDRAEQASIRYTVPSDQPLPTGYPEATDQQTPVQGPVLTEQQMPTTLPVSTDKPMSIEDKNTEKQMSAEHNNTEKQMSTELHNTEPQMSAEHNNTEKQISIQHNGGEKDMAASTHQRFSTEHRVTIEHHLPLEKTAQLDQHSPNEQTAWCERTLFIWHSDLSDETVTSRRTASHDQSATSTRSASADQGSSTNQPLRTGKSVDTDSYA